MENISKALVEAQLEMSNPVKGAKNPFFNSKYADLNSVREAVIPVLNKHGISVLQPMTTLDGRNFVKTVLLHESGESLESLTEIVYSKKGDAQSQGSGITYARRYGLQSLVCVGADDDDGNKASVSLEIALEDANMAGDLEALEMVWDSYEVFHTNPKFKAKVTEVKKRINGAKAK